MDTGYLSGRMGTGGGMTYTFTEKHRKILRDILDGGSDIVLLDSSIRSGKTLLCVLATVLYAMERVPTGAMIAIMGYSMTSISQNIDIYLRDVCADLHIQMTNSPIKGCFRLQNTNGHYVEVVYFSAKDASSFRGIQGKTLHDSILFCDEVTLYNEEAFNQALARVTGRSKILLTCNPDRANHWVKKRFIDEPKGLKISRHRLTLYDNPGLDQESIARFEALYSGTFYRRYILGEWCSSDALVFPMFQDSMIYHGRDHHTGKTAIGSDFGATDPTTALRVVFTPNKIYVTDEYYYRANPELGIPDLSSDTLARRVRAWMQKAGSLACPVYFDPAAKHWGVSLKNQGLRVAAANNTVLARTDKVGQMVGITLMQSLFENDLLAVSASCENLIQELYNWSWEKDRANTPEKGNDHCIDALRYVLNSNYALANKILLQSVRMRKEVAV